MLKLEQITLPIKYTDEDIKKAISRKIKVNCNDIKEFELIKLSIDARKKPNIKYVASVTVTLKGDLEKKFKTLIYKKAIKQMKYSPVSIKQSCVVVGFGPSGMFAALSLARMGLEPIIIEQGKSVDERTQDIEDFWKNRKLNTYSNVQFGEGGAGTFSDGKLNSNLDNEYCKVVLYELYMHGAPKEILYLNKPHIGTDNLRIIVKQIREEIISLGGKFLFSHKMTDLKIEDGRVKAIEVLDILNNTKKLITADNVLLCVGHSARDTFKMLYERNAEIKQKPFAMGVRIEQKQSDVNMSQYGAERIDGLPNADYKLVAHLPNGRSIFTFCMCPGGEVVASSSNENEIVTNGMSNFARDKENANSAVLINIVPEDYYSNHPLAGINFQAKYEKLAFELAGSNYNAPAESVGSFLGKSDIKTNINYTYRPSLTFCKIEKCLPKIVSESLKLGLIELNKKMKGFAKDENLLIAIESRTSCPLTIVRDENYESNIKGLYPVGEGAGYAGGIMSSAQDGLKVAEKIYEILK